LLDLFEGIIKMKKEKLEDLSKNPISLNKISVEENLELIEASRKAIKEDGRLIELKNDTVVFVGDTHGDFDASRKIIKTYKSNKIVFLGDYVDRGTDSWANINFLLTEKILNKNGIFLLQGNHEGMRALRFSPADFWDSLTPSLREEYELLLSELPYATSVNGVIALHGALPDISRLDEIKGIEFGSRQWEDITWGDWQELEGDFLGYDPFTGRPKFGRRRFETTMKKIDKDVLIRSHQPDAKLSLFNGRCITIFTSSAYAGLQPVRRIALLQKEAKNVDDLEIVVV
jgi:protein phosphatase